MPSTEDEIKEIVQNHSWIKRSNNPAYGVIRWEEYAILHASLSLIKQDPKARVKFNKGPSIYKPNVPEEIKNQFKTAAFGLGWVIDSINHIAQTESMAGRINDLFTNSSSVSFSKRLGNVFGLHNDYTVEPNRLGSNALALVGGSVKETKQVSIDGTPLSASKLDAAMAVVKDMFFDDVEDVFGVKPDRNQSVGNIFNKLQDAIARKQEEDSDAQVAKENSAQKLAEQKPITKDEVIAEINSQLDRFRDKLVSLKKSVSKTNEYLEAIGSIALLESVLEKIESKPSQAQNLSKLVLSYNKDHDRVSRLSSLRLVRDDSGDSYEASIGEVLSGNDELKLLEEDILVRIVPNALDVLISQYQAPGDFKKLKLLEVIKAKFEQQLATGTVSAELNGLIVSFGFVSTAYPIGNLLADNLKTVEKIIQDDIAKTGIFDEQEISDMTLKVSVPDVESVDSGGRAQAGRGSDIQLPSTGT